MGRCLGARGGGERSESAVLVALGEARPAGPLEGGHRVLADAGGIDVTGARGILAHADVVALYLGVAGYGVVTSSWRVIAAVGFSPSETPFTTTHS